MVVQLCAGGVIGIILASIGWGVFFRVDKKKKDNTRREREEIMHDLGEMWVDVDTLISSFRSGMMDDRTFKSTFTAKIDAINHLLKPNMHLFEVYYVKYMEILIKEYNRIVHLRELPSDISSVLDSSSELETQFTPSPEQTDLFNPPAENPAVISSSEEVPLDRAQVDEKTTLMEQDELPEGKSVETIKMEAIRGAEDTSEDVMDISKQGDPAGPASQPEVSNDVDTMFDDAFSVIESAGAEEDTPEENTDSIAETEEEKKSDVHIAQEAVEDKKEPLQYTAPESSFSGFDDEEVTTETLMDVDLGTIASHMARDTVSSSVREDDVERTRHFEKMPEDDNPDMVNGKTQLEVVIASDASHADDEDDKDEIPEETTYTRAEEIENKSTEKVADDAAEVEEAVDEDEDFEVIIPDDTSTTAAVEVAEENVETTDTGAPEESITGDDVADKIAALEAGKPLEQPKDGNEVQPEVKAEESPANTAEKKPEKKKGKKSGKKNRKKTENKIDEKSEKHEKSEQDEKREIASESEVGKPEETRKISLKDQEESITGNDVADQIDSFFGLFKEE